MVRVGSLLVVFAACGRVGFDAGDGAPPVNCEQPSTFFADADQDGHGNPGMPIQACVQPPLTAVIDDDCDDTDALRFPGAAEVCDGRDNDCDAGTVELCVVGCIPQRRPPPDDAHRYLFCAGAETWTSARDLCVQQGYQLATVDDAVENDWLATTATVLNASPQQWIGANDRGAEGQWVWYDGTVFWSGNGAGTPVGGRFSSWDTQEPNNSDAMGENCASLAANKSWNDLLCIALRDYACEL